MPGKIVFLLEEASMKFFLEGLLPRIFPDWIEGEHFLCVKHEGKSDLDKSIPVKLKAWREPDVHFVIIRDADNADCVALKARLRKMCTAAGRSDSLIRLACQELESWYLGDLPALERAFCADLSTPRKRKRFACPDKLQKPSKELGRLIPGFQKIKGARAIAKHLSLDSKVNRSRSFQVFLEGVQDLVNRHDIHPDKSADS
jgi:hypothetical protein